MKELFNKYKSVLRFVAIFIGGYFLLSIAYGFYLDLSKEGVYSPDLITHLVAKQSGALLQGLGYDGGVKAIATEPAMVLYLNDTIVARVVEGCNAVSIIILFIAFVVSFYQKFKKTFLFILAGTVLIYSVNIIRIALLTIALYSYPEYEHILHGVLFPAIIYGMVFLLWIIWVRILKPTQDV
ncbi:exosortase family protein XrtF [Jejudonia soesokkakensis]|uniref:Exosortase family protein XrtF n=1 Tax=Jejudonia soesokkakensis TaxID=1323432 RepID=A0ABW2MR94_9FLAO